MSIYQLPEFKFKNRAFWLLVLIIFLSSFFGFLSGFISSSYFSGQINDYLKKLNFDISGPKIIKEETVKEYIPQTSQEKAVIDAVKKVSPAVVSIIITKDLPVVEEFFISPFEEFPFEIKIPQFRQKGTQKQEVGSGSGFIISEDGMILTNKHVVLDESSEYTVLTNDGQKFPAKVLAKDPVQDIAVIKIEKPAAKFPTVLLGDSDKLEIGQTVIAIGNVLGEFRNSVSVGVISGLGRTITAGEGNFVETIEDIIQTDAAINKGNSGGPLLNLKGEVIGINTATVIEAQSIGFAIPINKAKKDIEQVKKTGKITFPFLGVRYVLVNEQIQKDNNLPINYGALVIRGEKGEAAVASGSAAQIAGIKEGDIILEFRGEKITIENTLAKVISKYNPGDKIILKVLRKGKEIIFEVTLGERN